ncbi:hypothetical protein [Streptomyces hygroscopicus]|uniref:hypothetical protein n=1 Tax=Streptomyces hygroscopicus TaxID=1912 RepID=UPI00368D0B61
MKDTKALTSLADLICRAQKQGRRTPMGIAMAIDAEQRHMTPEMAAELHDLRTRLAGMANPPREVFLALYDGAEPELFATAEAARECCDDLAKTDAHGKYWDWIVNEYGVHVQFWTHPDDDRPLSETPGSVTPVVVQGDEPLSELERLRSRVAELEAERQTTNAALADVTVALRAAESAQTPGGYAPVFPWAKWLDEEDLPAFLDELAAAAILNASSARRLAEVEQTCASWRPIAESFRAHLTAPGPNCTCAEPVLECTGVTCGCPVCHRAVVPAADEPVPYVPTELPAPVTFFADQAAAKLRQPVDGGERP